MLGDQPTGSLGDMLWD